MNLKTKISALLVLGNLSVLLYFRTISEGMILQTTKFQPVLPYLTCVFSSSFVINILKYVVIGKFKRERFMLLT